MLCLCGCVCGGPACLAPCVLQPLHVPLPRAFVAECAGLIEADVEVGAM